MITVTQVTDDDTLMSKDAFYAKVEKAISEVKAGQTHSMKPNESLDDFLDRMEAEGQ